MKPTLTAAITAGITFASSLALAHGVDENRAFVRLSGDTAYVVITPPSEAFVEYDEDDDGRVDEAEVREARYALLSTMQRMLTLRDEAGRTAEPIFADVGTAAHGDHLRFTLRYRWLEAPKSLSIRYELADVAPMRVQASRVTTARQLDRQEPLGPAVRVELTDPDQSHTFWPVVDAAAAPAEEPSSGFPYGLMLVACGVVLARPRRSPTQPQDGEKSR